ncbi:hypothetical protein PsYK624_172220 [Phanerochaete sordida]|uniref:Uncharacterized protein n=1 Tax=Phanerochaete sordida TaxID=48140 RepID=A0A9P3LPW6_9APHY|nr:hypothetical protein PsYK624_172220 [Phanerochaete sordida]
MPSSVAVPAVPPCCGANALPWYVVVLPRCSLLTEPACQLSPAASMSSGEPSDTGVRVDTAASPISSSWPASSFGVRRHARAFVRGLARSALRRECSQMLASRLPPPARRRGSWISVSRGRSSCLPWPVGAVVPTRFARSSPSRSTPRAPSSGAACP